MPEGITQKCLRCGRLIRRVRVKVARSDPLTGKQEPTHYEVGWRHVKVVINGRKARCLRARSHENQKVRGKRGTYLKVYGMRKRGWEAEGEKYRKLADLKAPAKKAKKEKALKNKTTYKITR